MPQCQSPVHEGHEGKSDEACNNDGFVQDDELVHYDDDLYILTMIFT